MATETKNPTTLTTTTLSSFHMDPKEVNAALEMFLPELRFGNRYAAYPMRRTKWLEPDDTYEKKPGFVAVDKDGTSSSGNSNSNSAGGMKIIPDYVYCKNGPKGSGYYHILTRMPWANLYTRLQNDGNPVDCMASCFVCFQSKETKQKLDMYDTACRIVYARIHSPDDAKAQENQLVNLSNGHGV